MEKLNNFENKRKWEKEFIKTYIHTYVHGTWIYTHTYVNK